MEQFHLLFCSVFSGIQGQEPIVWCILLQNSHFDPNFTLDPENLHKFPQPLVTAHGLGHLGSECSRNSSEPILNLYFNQRAACHCSSSFYHIFQSCSGRNIVSLVRINSRMFVLTLLKHNFHILQLLPERSWRIARGHCKERAEVPRERMPKRGKAGQRVPRSILGSWVRAGQRAWLQPGGCALMGCRCPISDGQGWAKAQPGRAGTETKRKSGNRKNTWGYLILWLKSPIYYRGLYIVIDKQ